MSWPTITSAQDNIAGVTTIRWGTGGSFPSAQTAVVISADQDVDTEAIYLENGEGLKATRVLLQHGFKWNYTIQDDSSLFPSGMNVNDQVIITHFIGSGVNYVKKGTIVNTNYRAARKQEGHRVIQVDSITLIDTTSS